MSELCLHIGCNFFEEFSCTPQIVSRSYYSGQVVCCPLVSFQLSIVCNLFGDCICYTSWKSADIVVPGLKKFYRSILNLLWPCMANIIEESLKYMKQNWWNSNWKETDTMQNSLWQVKKTFWLSFVENSYNIPSSIPADGLSCLHLDIDGQTIKRPIHDGN